MDERYELLNRPEVYKTVTRLALSSREPFRSHVLGIKDPAAENRFDLAHNSWLMPLKALHTQYLHHGHDGFNLPPELFETWKKLAKTINDNDCNNKG